MKELMPELRFPEFEGEWEKKKIGDIAKVIGGGTPNTSNEEFWEGDIPWVSSSDINANDIRTINISRYITENALKESATKLVPENSLLIVSRVGVGKLAVSREEICTSQDFSNVILDESQVSSYYLGYNLSSNVKIFDRISQGTSIKGFTNEDLKSIKVKFPILQEQTKIADFLSAVDEQISLLTEKQVKLQTYKRGVMQKLFSQELRFKDEHGADYPEWEKKKLGELLTVQSGRDYKHLKEGDIPVFGSGGLMLFVEDFLYDGKSVCIGRKGTIDKPMFVNGKFWTVDTLFYTNNFEGCIPEYIYQQFLNINWKRYNEAGGVPSLSKKIINNITIDISSISEQTKIANFLTAIDVQLEEVEAQIAQTKVFKQGLLQKMFV